MSGQRADSRRDEEVAAAYASGLSDRACAVKFGIGRAAVRGALKRTGTPPRKAGRPRKPAAGDGGTQRPSRSESATLRHAREAAERDGCPWAAQAAARHLAGVPSTRLAREYGVSWRRIRAAIEGQGVAVTLRPRGRPSAGAG